MDHVEDIILGSDIYWEMEIVDRITGCPRDLTDCSGTLRIAPEGASGYPSSYTVERGYYDIWVVSGIFIFHLLGGDFTAAGDYDSELDLENPDHTHTFFQDDTLRIIPRI